MLMIMENKVVYQGPGVLSLLLVAFIVLKLCGVITWSWWLVLSPLWAPIIIGLILLLIMGIVVYLNTK